MTRPDAPLSPWPEDPVRDPLPLQARAALPGVRALDGNRAALALLLVQNIVSAFCMMSQRVPLGDGTFQIGLGWPLGLSLLTSFVLTTLVGFTLFRPAMTALLRDSRWRTPPSLGLALAGFVLGFLASRALALAYITLVPGAEGSMPTFLSRGTDVWVLILAAGLLVPLAEEVAFRGLMMRGHERAAGFGLAAVTSTLAFSIAHGVPASIVGIVPLAYVLARIVQHTGSLWNAVIIHALNNTLSVALGAALMKNNLSNQDQAMELLKNEALRVPLALGALLFGGVMLFVAHLLFTPKADPQERAAPGPWLSAAYVVIVLFGLFAILMGIPGVQEQVSHLRGVMR